MQNIHHHNYEPGPGAEQCEVFELHEDKIRAVSASMPDENEIYDLAELFKVFGDSTRMRILFALFEADICVCDIAAALNMTQSAISSRRDGKSVIYSLADEHVRTIIGQGREHIEE